MFAAAAAGACAPVASAPAPPAEWIAIGVATDGTKALVDAQTIQSTGGEVRVRQRFILGKPRAGGTRFLDQDVIYHCPRRSAKTLSTLAYDATGLIEQVSRHEAEPEQRILPGTLPEYIFDVLC
jgi:hypothetical protein